MVRPGFSFIELVVSIVVIGIVFMSVPLMLTETRRSTEFSIQQEGIMATATTMVNVLSYRWDEADTNKTLNGGFAKVCDVNNGAADLNRTNLTSNRRKGHFKGEYRRKFFDYTYLADPNINTFATSSGNLGLEPNDGNVPDDIDDFEGKTYSLSGGGVQDYKYDYTVETAVYYISDNFTYSLHPVMNGVDISTDKVNKTTNIKMVKVAFQSDEGNITLYGFSSNIGEYKILHRTFE